MLPIIALSCLNHTMALFRFLAVSSIVCLLGQTAAFVPSTISRSIISKHETSSPTLHAATNQAATTATALLSITLLTLPILSPLPAQGVTDQGASSFSNSKITTGGASTLQSGRTISITRGVNLDNSDFSNRNLKGVAFQQSIVRDSDFRNSNLVGASFFDATLDGSNFENAGEGIELCS